MIVNALDPIARRLALPLALLAIGLAVPTAARGQLPSSEERLKILTDPESVKKKLDKDKSRPPIEMFRSQVAPFDILPYVKANHWSTISLELRANYDDYSGLLQSNPVSLLGLPQEMIYARDARLAKTQRSRIGLQVMLPVVPKEIGLELIRPDAIRADDVWPASIRTLEPHQMLILFLTKEANDTYATWNRFSALYPLSTDRDDIQAIDKARYYRLVLPLEPDKPMLSSHPLTWTTVSHVVWDGMSPDKLNPSQQQAMLDWLHWGGQLVLVGGAGPAFSILRDSFLNPYLPADPTGENSLLTKDDLRPLAQAYPPPFRAVQRFGVDDEAEAGEVEFGSRLNDRYRKPVAINPAPDRPVFLQGLKPKPGAVALPLGGPGDKLIAVEQRVGRGRVTMLAFNPTDPAFAKWPGLDTLVRRLVLRRPEEDGQSPRSVRPGVQGRYQSLSGPSLSWFRYLSRDMGVTARTVPLTAEALLKLRGGQAKSASEEELSGADVLDYLPPGAAVAEWIDTAAVPRLSRDALEVASGIKIPDSRFVLKVLLAYILALVPLNWLLCRYVFGRKELAWLIVPTLALGFAVAVERAAAFDVGYNSACDEIDVVEVHGDYPRAHLSRFASLYSTGRTRFSIAFPDDPTALALPLDTGRSLRGEDVVTSTFRSYPTPALQDYLVQPRSLAMFRAEQMISLDGAVSLVGDEGDRKVVNQGGLELRDAVLVDFSVPKSPREILLGTIGPGQTVEVKPSEGSTPSAVETVGIDPGPLLKQLRAYYEDQPENRGELRLVAWAPKPMPGPTIEPAVDRHRGFTAFVIRLKSGPPPGPDGTAYDATAKADEPPAPRRPRTGGIPMLGPGMMKSRATGTNGRRGR